LDFVVDAVLEGDGRVERGEFVVLIVDEIRVGEVDCEDADALSSCATGPYQ
jgi:hypothetical protein